MLLFNTPLKFHEFYDIDLGTKDYILSLPCKAHCRLFAEVLTNSQYPDFYQSPIQSIFCYKTEGERVWFCGKFAIGSNQSSVISTKLNLLSSNPRWGPKPAAQIVHPQWIKHGLPRRWKEHCDCRHGAECRRVPLAAFLTRGRPKWIIDVWRSCLVPGSHAVEYVTLSYVWGKRKFVTTTKDNFDCFRRPGAFSALPLPNTIRDALGFTEMLGVRYLWVDSLCIVQDDTDAKFAELENMSAIYANASVTIIASDGRDAYSGLAGLQGISGPRASKQVIFDLDHGAKLLRQQDYETEDYETETVWSTRAWTFQEHLCSNRRIIFENDCARWECSKGLWHEAALQMDGLNAHRSEVERRGMLSSNFPDLLGLHNQLRVYNNRNLTYPEDALNAFAGIMRALCPTFKSGFLSGLPLAFFNIALLWQPLGYAVRRVASEGVSGATCLPSWSWAGWKCSVTTSNPLMGLSMGNDYIKRHAFSRSWTNRSWTQQPSNEVLIPHVQWHSHRDLNAIGIPILSDWYEYKKKYFNTEAAAPAGWTKHALDKDSLRFGSRWPEYFLNPESVPKWFYKHKSDPDSEFWYPIPLPSTTDESVSIVSEPYLSCWTHRVWAFGGNYQSESWPPLRLNDKNGKEIGFLKLLEIPPLNGENDDSKNKYLGQPIELVDIAIGYGNNDPGVSKFHHVMWIEWEDKVAYRKGLGKVPMEAWEEQDRESIHLMLG
jgi:hypothetical protein